MRADALARRWAALWNGVASPWPAALFRIGVAATVLARTSDWLRPWLALDHHGWVRGLEYDPTVEALLQPSLHSPLVLFLPELSGPVAHTLVVGRTVLAALLLVGISPRVTAGLLAIVGWGLMASDRYRYFHHLQLLWLSCAWVAVMPSGARLSLASPAMRRARPGRVPRWPLQLARFQLLVIYAASGIAKLRADWLDGTTLRFVERVRLVDGSLFDAALAVAPYAALSVGVCATELALPVLLVWRRTRLLGIAIACCFHAAISATMTVSTFGFSMTLYLLLFLPSRAELVAPAAQNRRPATARARQ